MIYNRKDLKNSFFIANSQLDLKENANMKILFYH